MSTELAQGDICAFDLPNTSKQPFSKKMRGLRVFEGLREFEERSNPYITKAKITKAQRSNPYITKPLKSQISTVLAQGDICAFA